MSDTKTITIKDILTSKELLEAIRIHKDGKPMFAHEICAKFTAPNIGRINAKIGQVNDPMYLAYAVEHILNQATKR